MKRWLASLLGVLILIASPLSLSQGSKSYSQAELDRMLAPIALYPDPLLSQILMASTYPIEVVEAARWSRANPGLRGDDAVRAVEGEDWDPSVKSLVAFPQVLQRMDENLEWMRSLGDAFLAQQPHVMETVQQLRQRAHAAGNLRSSDQLQVQQQGQAIYIQPVSPQVVYVPYYDPLVVYGPWWWPAYRPVVWAPWPGYVRPRPGVHVSFWWGTPVAVSTGFFFGNFDWHRRHVHVHHVHHVHHHHRTLSPGVWRHDPHHRRGVEYRDAAVRQQFAANPQAREERREGRRDERRDERRDDRREQRAIQAQPRPQVQPQAQPQARRDEERAQRREERRQERPVARDLQDSKVLSPRPAEQRPQVQAQPRVQQQVQPRPQQQVQERPRRVQQEERKHAREERREQRQEKRQEARQGNGRGG